MTGASDVCVGVLGPTTVFIGRTAVSLTPIQRRLLAALALSAPAGSSPESLVEQVWGLDAPVTARQSLHNHLGRLRRQLPPPVICWNGRRYQLDTTQAAVDVDAFERTCAEAVEISAAGDASTMLHITEAALSLWRGEPFEDLADDDTAVETERFRLHELHAEIEELNAQALLDVGDAGAVARLQHLVRARPERERRWAQVMVALARSGRRSDALQTYREAQRFFADELQLRPPEALTRLHRKILTEELPDELGEPDTGPIVGRDALLDELNELLDGSQLVALTGEAGIGKSTVVKALAQRREKDGRRTVRVTCLTNPWSAVQPVVDLLDDLRPELAELPRPPGRGVVHLLATSAQPPLELERPPSRDASVLAHELADALEQIAQRAGGLTLILDDAHRGGPTSHRLLLVAVDRCPRVHLVVTTRRQDALPQSLQDRAQIVAVGPLELDGTRALASRVLQDQGHDEELVQWLHELTGGNPLFATAVLDDLQRRGSLRRDETGALRPPADIEVPPRLHEIVETTIAALALATRRALDVAAVLDDPVDEELLVELTDPAPLDGAIGGGILEHTGPGLLRFRHELVRRVTYDLVPAGRRIELHHAVATLLRERGAAAPLVAGHALKAVDLDPAGAAQAARAAGEAALRAVAFEEAAGWFDRAADAAAADGSVHRTDLIALRVEAADARRLAGLPGHAETLLDLAEEAVLLDDDPLRRRAVLAAVELGETGEVGPLQRRAAEVAAVALERERDPAARATISAAASMVHSLSGEPERCRQLFVDALSALDDDDAATGSRVLPYAYMGLAHVDDLESRTQAAARLRRDAAAVDDPVAQFEGWHLTFSVALQRADGALARHAHDEMRGLLDRVGDAGRRWSFTYQEAALAHLDGRLEAAERAADEALTIGSGFAPARALGAYSGQLVELRRAAGRLAELAPLMTQLVEEQDTLPAWRAVASFVLADVDADRSRQLFDELAPARFAALPRDFAWLAAVHVLARGAVQRRDRRQAAVAGEVLAPYRDLGCWQGTCSYGPVAIVLAQIALLRRDQETAAVLAALAVERARSLGAPAYVAEAEAVLAAAATGRGEGS